MEKSNLILTAIAAIALAAAGTLAQTKNAQTVNSFKDSRDGKTYKTVTINSQTWMAQNLNYEAKGSVCLDNKTENCKKYGRLYDWETANKVCPAGFHLPSKDEWEELVDYVNYVSKEKTAGKKLKTTSGWKDYKGISNDYKVTNGNGTDDYGFSALPAGYGMPNGHAFSIWSEVTLWWSATEDYPSGTRISDYAWYRMITNENENVLNQSNNKLHLQSVRCMADIGGIYDYQVAMSRYEKETAKSKKIAAPANTLIDSRDGKTYNTVKIGSQTWMKENLNYAAQGSVCYDNKKLNCDLLKYGRLYDFETAKQVCPEGWHLPTDAEWTTLTDYVGDKETAGTKLKTTSGWNDNPEGIKAGWNKKSTRDDNGTDDFGFSALPGGMGGPGGYFVGAISTGYWWSATSSSAGYAWMRYIYCNDFEGVGRSDQAEKTELNSVRCVQGEGGIDEYQVAMARYEKEELPKLKAQAAASVSSFKDKRDGKNYKTVKIGEQTWMKENLNYETKGGVCNDDKDENCAKYGRLYDWETAQKVCPDGWRLPNRDDWNTLVDNAGGWEKGGIKLKSKSGWEDFEGKESNGSDDFGFSALPGGHWNKSGLKYGFGKENTGFDGIGTAGYWWNNRSDKYGDYARASRRYMLYSVERVGADDENSIGSMSVRCIQGSIDEYEVAMARREKETQKSNTEKVETTAERDAKKYRTVKIGTQTWMADNLNYAAKGSKCYDNKPENCEKYGRLYDWPTALKACPAGFHLPSRAELETLVNYAGGEVSAGAKLKSKSGWNDFEGTSGNGNDDYRFSALPGGYGIDLGKFFYGGEHGYWWSATGYRNDNAMAIMLGMNFFGKNAILNVSDKTSEFLSLRCLADKGGIYDYNTAMARYDNEKQKSNTDTVEKTAKTAATTTPATPAPAAKTAADTGKAAKPADVSKYKLTAIANLANGKSLKKGMTDAEFAQAYEIAAKLMAPYSALSREKQIETVAKKLYDEYMKEGKITYSDKAAHYNDVYGFFVNRVSSCAGATRAVGLCLNILGIEYQHINENKWDHQWCRIKVGEKDWLCDVFFPRYGPEDNPYTVVLVNTPSGVKVEWKILPK